MKLSVFLSYAIFVPLAVSSPSAISRFNSYRNFPKRGELPGEEGRGGGDPEVRPRPDLVNAEPHDGNRNQPSVPEVVQQEPKYPYQEKPFPEVNGEGKDPAVGETAFVDPLGALPRVAKQFFGLDDEAYEKAMADTGFITAAVNGRRFSGRASPLSPYEQQRAVGKDQYLAAVKEFGMEPELPPTWEQGNGLWLGKAVDLEDEAAMRRYRQTMKLRQRILESVDGLSVEFIDNTGKPPPALNRRSIDMRGTPASRPIPRPVNGGPLGQTLLEEPAASQHTKQSELLKRVDSITQITTAVNDPNKNNTDAFSASFQMYLSAFNTAQSNVSSLIFPVLDKMLNGTNSSIVYSAAWSIYSDLTGSSPIILGPFMFGLHCLDWIEDQLWGTNPNISAMNATEQFSRNKILAFHSVLLDMYYYAWDNALAAVNKTGLVDDMSKLAGYMDTNNSAILDAFAGFKSPPYDARYFTVYNETVLPDSAYGNLTK